MPQGKLSTQTNVTHKARRVIYVAGTSSALPMKYSAIQKKWNHIVIFS